MRGPAHPEFLVAVRRLSCSGPVSASESEACKPCSLIQLCAAPPPPYACKPRAVYLANLAACDIARGDNSEALRACSAAIEEDPTYIKAGARMGL